MSQKYPIITGKSILDLKKINVGCRAGRFMYIEELYNAVQCIPLSAEFKDYIFWNFIIQRNSLVIAQFIWDVWPCEKWCRIGEFWIAERRIFLFHPQYKYALSVANNRTIRRINTERKEKSPLKTFDTNFESRIRLFVCIVAVRSKNHFIFILNKRWRKGSSKIHNLKWFFSRNVSHPPWMFISSHYNFTDID